MQLSIEQVENRIQNVLSKIRNEDSTDSDVEFLIPPGYRPAVTLKVDGRKKRRNASFDYWSPENGEISISFVRDEPKDEPKPAGTGRKPTSIPANVSARTGDSTPSAANKEDKRQTPSHALSVRSPEQELCEALAEVESQGRAFIALKFFRDRVLPAKGFTWAERPDERQAVLTRAIENGRVVTGRIANPQSPSYPTTTIRLNRNHSEVGDVHRRYAPVRIRGQALSETILRDRGAR
jgi:hypothetical protein